MKTKLYKGWLAQINIELLASYKYQGISIYLQSINLEGLSKWFMDQSKEEAEHAQKIIEHLLDVGKKVELKQLASVTVDYKGVEDVLRTALDNEIEVSHSIRKLYDIAFAEREYGSFSLLQWFVNEQIEEEKKFEDLIGKFLQYKNEQYVVRLDKFIASEKS